MLVWNKRNYEDISSLFCAYTYVVSLKHRVYLQWLVTLCAKEEKKNYVSIVKNSEGT